VQRIVARVEIEHHFPGVLGQSAHAHLQERRFDLLGIMRQLVVAARLHIAQFQPIERGAPRQRLALIAPGALRAQRIFLAGCHRQERIAAQRVVIVEILVAQRQAVEALGEQLLHAVLDVARIAPVRKARRQLGAHPQPTIDALEQQPARIRAQVTAAEIRDHFARAKVLKKHRLLFTVCFAGGARLVGGILFHTNYLPEAGAALQILRVKYAG
jgi:hypothetical protein